MLRFRRFSYHERVLSRLRSWRRARILARYGASDELWHAATEGLVLRARLGAEREARLREMTALFLHAKRLDAAGGLDLDDAMRVRLAALACEPILELGLESLDEFRSVVVHPTEFIVRGREEVDEDGVVHVGDDVLSGEAWDQGPVVLAWDEVEASGRGEGYNVVAHEIAHKLDLLTGAVNGLPPLHEGMRREEWTRSFRSAYDELLGEMDRGREPWIDPYAAEDPGEFFAVCTEVFFDVPAEFARRYPAVYGQLRAFFKQDPAADAAPRSRSRRPHDRRAPRKAARATRGRLS
ncbi:MAG TPA: M90 family metallopeptidase [Gammaproteobacteria bacterium]|nr:M90 family metallopeptidase [Gammaproteobacteria bacterium]